MRAFAKRSAVAASTTTTCNSCGEALGVMTIERNGLQTNAVHTELGFVIAEALVYQLINQALP